MNTITQAIASTPATALLFALVTIGMVLACIKHSIDVLAAVAIRRYRHLDIQKYGWPDLPFDADGDVVEDARDD